MGQFLHISLTYQYAITKTELEKSKLSANDVIHKIGIDSTLYELTEDEDDYVWTLRKEVLGNHLVGFLESFYPSYYPNKVYYENILTLLQGKDADFLIQIAEQKHEEVYQMDKNFDFTYLYFEDKPFRPELKLYFRGITLALAGKIMMETYNQMLAFLTEALQMRFAPNPLAKALKLYISM